MTIGNLSGQPVFQIRVPHLLSLIATLPGTAGSTASTRSRHAEAARYGPGSYVPVVGRLLGLPVMVGLGFLMLLVSAWSLWRSRRRGKPFELGRWTLWVLVASIAAPFLANTAGWLFTEIGRQPWIVYGLMKTGDAASPTVSATDVALTFGGFVLLYTVLGVIDVRSYVSGRPARTRHRGEEPPTGPPREGARGTRLLRGP